MEVTKLSKTLPPFGSDMLVAGERELCILPGNLMHPLFQDMFELPEGSSHFLSNGERSYKVCWWSFWMQTPVVMKVQNTLVAMTLVLELGTFSHTG